MSFSTNANDYGNAADVEMMWAKKTFQHAEVHFNLLCAVNDPKFLKLTAVDDVIYSKFREEMKDFDVGKLDEDNLKSPASKELWRNFCDQFKDLTDYNFGTLLRLNPADEYSQTNTTLAPRVQFLAIEIARNREGYNLGLNEKFGKSNMETS